MRFVVRSAVTCAMLAGAAVAFAQKGETVKVAWIDPLSGPLTGGKAVKIYAQHDVIKDLVKVRLETGGDIRFDASSVSVHDIDSEAPKVRYRSADGSLHEIDCDFVAGCDGTQGISRPSIPKNALDVYERLYPFGWVRHPLRGSAVADENETSLAHRVDQLVASSSDRISLKILEPDLTKRN